MPVPMLPQFDQRIGAKAMRNVGRFTSLRQRVCGLEEAPQMKLAL